MATLTAGEKRRSVSGVGDLAWEQVVLERRGREY